MEILSITASHRLFIRPQCLKILQFYYWNWISQAQKLLFLFKGIKEGYFTSFISVCCVTWKLSLKKIHLKNCHTVGSILNLPLHFEAVNFSLYNNCILPYQEKYKAKRTVECENCYVIKYTHAQYVIVSVICSTRTNTFVLCQSAYMFIFRICAYSSIFRCIVEICKFLACYILHTFALTLIHTQSQPLDQ